MHEDSPVSGYPLKTRSLKLQQLQLTGLTSQQSSRSQPLSPAPAGWFMLAFGFQTFALRQKTRLSCLSTVFQRQPDTGSNEISGIMISLLFHLRLHTLQTSYDDETTSDYVHRGAVFLSYTAGALPRQFLKSEQGKGQRSKVKSNLGFLNMRCPQLTISGLTTHGFSAIHKLLHPSQRFQSDRTS
jgi:hypothetical protein